MTRPWEVVEERATAAALHGDRLPVPDRRLVRVALASGPALVLGSAQRLVDVDLARAADLGVEVVRRRSGGGAVLVVPGDVAWLDVCLPRADPLWVDDVGRSAAWLGPAMASALLALGVEGATAHTGGMRRTAWSDQVCFAGLAPGEVVVGGRKVVGISQRRTAAGAVFQVAVLLRWDPGLLIALLRLPDGAAPALAITAAGLDELGAGTGDVLAAVLRALSS